MKSFLKIGALLTLAVLLLSGCGPKIKPPSAGDTLGGNGANANWNGGSDVGSGILNERGAGIPADLMERIKNGTVDPKDIVVSVYFDFDQYGIRGSERGKLDGAASTLNSESGLRVVAVGYTDWYGTEQYNLALAERRAQSVKSYLTQLGIADARVEVLSMGKMQATPNVEKNSPEAQHDRRVDVIKINGGGSVSSTPAAAPAEL